MLQIDTELGISNLLDIDQYVVEGSEAGNGSRILTSGRDEELLQFLDQDSRRLSEPPRTPLNRTVGLLFEIILWQE